MGYAVVNAQQWLIPQLSHSTGYDSHRNQWGTHARTYGHRNGSENPIETGKNRAGGSRGCEGWVVLVVVAEVSCRLF